MIDQRFREILPRFVAPLLKIYRRLGLTPNRITILGLGLGLVSAFLVAQGRFSFAIGVWWGGRLLDGTDGIYARTTGQVSDFGGYLDILCDMLAYSAMILGFAWRYPEWHLYWSIILVGYVLCATSALALGALERKRHVALASDNRTLRLSAGLAEGGETGIAYTLFLFFPGALPTLLVIWIVVLSLTVIARSRLAYLELR